MKGGMKLMGRTTNGVQIRVVVDKLSYQSLKDKAKALGMNLEHYSGLILSGYEITKKV